MRRLTWYERVLIAVFIVPCGLIALYAWARFRHRARVKWLYYQRSLG